MRLHANLLLLSNYHRFGNLFDLNVTVVEGVKCFMVINLLRVNLQILDYCDGLLVFKIYQKVCQQIFTNFKTLFNINNNFGFWKSHNDKRNL